ncbi:MAG: Ig-like domain-containing protein [Dysgonomonas sp.]
MKKINNILQSTKKAAKYFVAPCLLGLLSLSSVEAQGKITGLSDYKLYLDPGHAIKQNQGLFNYSEAEKVLRVALSMREYLQTYTDIGTIYMCRETDLTDKTLSERTDEANSLGVDFYYSIHSDASSDPNVNSTVMLYGGRRVTPGSEVVEKLPEGGKKLGDILVNELSGAMRIGTRGNVADLTYYNYTGWDVPYLHVNRESNMASLLSEGGYHTATIQQQRNLNAEWKRMEGLAAFRSFLKFQNLACPEIGIVSGFVVDDETGVPVNGATVKVVGTDKTYVTDSYESLFKNYSKDPDELHNGFYFIEGFNNGDNLTLEFSSPEFQTVTKTVTISTNATGETKDILNTVDVEMVNLVPAKVKSVMPKDLTSVIKEVSPLVITFTRKMDQASIASALSISPNKPLSLTWKDEYTLSIDLNQLDYLTDYTLTIDGSIAKNTHTNEFLDGDGDGTQGGNYVLNFKTAEQDNTAPVVVSYDPFEKSDFTRPIIRIQFDEELDETSVAADQIKVTSNGGVEIPGVLKHNVVNKISVLHYLFNSDLTSGETYKVTMSAGLKDRYGNAMSTGLEYTFNQNTRAVTDSLIIDDFENRDAWWDPSSSGSSAGLLPDPSKTSTDTEVTSSVNSPSALRMTYAWDESFSGVFRVRLYRSKAQPKFVKTGYVMQAWVFGDASNSQFRFAVRDNKDNGIKSSLPVVVDWVGWKLMRWDLENDESIAWVNTSDGILSTSNLHIDSFGWEPAGTPGTARPADFTTKYVVFDDLRLVKLAPTTGIGSIISDDSSISVKAMQGYINVSADTNIKDVKVYSLTGAMVSVVTPNSTEFDVPAANGVYVVKVVTENAQKNVKVLVK